MSGCVFEIVTDTPMNETITAVAPLQERRFTFEFFINAYAYRRKTKQIFPALVRVYLSFDENKPSIIDYDLRNTDWAHLKWVRIDIERNIVEVSVPGSIKTRLKPIKNAAVVEKIAKDILAKAKP